MPNSLFKFINPALQTELMAGGLGQNYQHQAPPLKLVQHQHQKSQAVEHLMTRWEQSTDDGATWQTVGYGKTTSIKGGGLIRMVTNAENEKLHV